MKGKLKLPGRLPVLLERYKYPILVLLLGLALLLWPSQGKGQSPQSPEPAATEAAGESESAYCARTARELEALLSQTEGAGRVRVMLTLKTGPALRYQTDRREQTEQEGERSSREAEEKTVMQNRGSAYNEPAVVSTAFPVFQGALIVAEGGGDPEVRLRLSAAVSALLGLGADQITVVKMK